MTREEMSKKITEGEYKITLAVTNGHRAHDNDEFKELRTEVEILRCIYFDYDPRFCKKKFQK